MKYFGKIYLSWRSGRGHRRYMVGVVKKNATDGVVFSYVNKEVEAAKKEGFKSYTEFPDTSKVYTERVLEILTQRLTPAERNDTKKLYEFWRVPTKCYSEPLCLLAFTQGWLPTDNFEFLADFYPSPDLCFVTDLAGLSSLNLKKGTIEVEQKLKWRHEEDNQYDKKAVAVYAGDIKVGYVKKAHVRIFHKKHAEQLQLHVHSIEQNGIIKKLFIRVSK